VRRRGEGNSGRTIDASSGLSKQPTHLSSDPPKASTATLAALQFERPTARSAFLTASEALFLASRLAA